nr:dihydrosphingosine 1-phosphate phosphatase [Quercus suber]
MPGSQPHARYAAHLRTPSPNKDPDAGMKGIDHYERRLPAWRFALRKWLIPVVRWETPYLAYFQETCRSPFLDSYFAISANLGTHTFFMTALPMCFWCGYPDLGLALVQMLALGVYLSGAVKDLVCLPRPLSPPLQRITMSGSAALEYGFPSTHTTNAVSVAIFILYKLYASRDAFSDSSYMVLCLLCYCYATSITIGRMYCGMHGLFDVIVGGVLGAFIAWLRIVYGPSFDQWVIDSDWTHSAIIVAVSVVAVRVHPEPADNCPCFDDSVSFSGVIIGVEVGAWHYAKTSSWSSLGETLQTSMYTLDLNDIIYPVVRVVLGIIIIFIWRAVMKPLSHRTLPPIFRFVDHWGFRLPRRYFLQSRDYKKVPQLRKDDNIIPTAAEIPSMMSNLRNPRQRSISIGPQSEADAREFIANREQRRRDSRTDDRSPRARPSISAVRAAGIPSIALPSSAIDDVAVATPAAEMDDPLHGSYMDAGSVRLRTTGGDAAASLQVDGVDAKLLTPPLSVNDDGIGKEDEKNDREMFSNLEKPRIRYDVEVITKLVVYAGIGWLAVDGNPKFFTFLGLV